MLFTLLVDNSVLLQATNAPSLDVDVHWVKYFEPQIVDKARSRSKQWTANQSKDAFSNRLFKCF